MAKVEVAHAFEGLPYKEQNPLKRVIRLAHGNPSLGYKSVGQNRSLVPVPRVSNFASRQRDSSRPRPQGVGIRHLS